MAAATCEQEQDQSKVPAIPAGWQRELTRFIGREDDLNVVAGLVADALPLVTVVGAPGIGKTRLAHHFTRSYSPGPAVFCDLRGVETAAGLCARLAECLDGHVEGGGDVASMVDAVGVRLASDERRLVVLDNFEQLPPDAVDVILHWLRTAPRVCFLVTSRRVLGLQCETVFELRPLSVASGADAASDAASLFIDRAKAAEPTFDETATEEVEAIVRQLQGIPLALELAARQMRRMRPARLIRELEAGPTIQLESAGRDVVPEHRSLRAAIESSWSALESWERATLSQLTACRQGFTAETCRAVVDLSDFPDAPDVETIVSTLRDASVIHVARGTKPSDVVRWDMYEAIREFAKEFPLRGAETRHAKHFLSLGGKQIRKFGTSDDRAARRELHRELGNLDATFRWFTAGESHGSSDEIAGLALVLFEIHRSSKPGLAISPLTTALETPEVRDARMRSTLYRARGACSRSIGDTSRAEADFCAARSHLSDGVEEGIALDIEEGILRFFLGDIRGARTQLSSAAGRSEHRGCERLEMHARTWLGRVLSEGFQDSNARTECERAGRLAEELGDARGRAVACWAAAVCDVYHQTGHVTEIASRLVKEARAAGDHEMESLSEQLLGVECLDREDYVRGRTHLRRAVEIARVAGMRRYEAGAYRWLTALEESAACAIPIQRRTLNTVRVYEQIGDVRARAYALLDRAANEANTGSLDRGYRLVEQAEAFSSGCEDAALAAFGAVQRARVEVAEGQQLADRGEKAAAKESLHVATNRVAPFRVDSDGAIAGCSVEVRWALRMFDREVGRVDLDRRTLRVLDHGGGFRLDGEGDVSLLKGPVIRRAFLALAKQQQKSPSTPMSTDALIGTCWPGERVPLAVRSQRVRQIIARLRKAGLRSVLLRGQRGYYLAPTLRVVIEPVEMTGENDKRRPGQAVITPGSHLNDAPIARVER